MSLSLMIKRTTADFGVELVASSEGAALFCALRKGGTERIKSRHGRYERHVMGIWHFVALTERGNSFETRQWHIPRYLMAREMGLRIKAFSQFSNLSASPIGGELFGLTTLMGSPDQLKVLLPDGVQLNLPKQFIRSLQSDRPLLEKAVARVKERSGLYAVPNLKTPAGHAVESACQELVEAVAFEKATRPRMSAENFGIYSAYCTYRDFDTSLEMPASLLRELLANQHARCPHELSDETYALFIKTQEAIFGQSIWGRGIKMSIDEGLPLLNQGMRSLTRHQRVQFILMNGMHGAGLFLPLATVTGAVSFRYYADQMCQHWQPDDPQEQDRRHETAYIRLYGELTSS